jgi:hypothetical protein
MVGSFVLRDPERGCNKRSLLPESRRPGFRRNGLSLCFCPLTARLMLRTMTRTGGDRYCISGPAGRYCGRELVDRIDNPTPDRHAGGVTNRPELVGPSGAFRLGRVALPAKYQAGDAPDVDLCYHAGKDRGGSPINV